MKYHLSEALQSALPFTLIAFVDESEDSKWVLFYRCFCQYLKKQNLYVSRLSQSSRPLPHCTGGIWKRGFVVFLGATKANNSSNTKSHFQHTHAYTSSGHMTTLSRATGVPDVYRTLQGSTLQTHQLRSFRICVCEKLVQGNLMIIVTL